MDWSRPHYCALLETLPEPALLVEAGDRVCYANTRAAALLGYAPGALQDQPLAGVLAFGGPSLPTSGQGHELRLLARDGTQVWAVASVGPVSVEGRPLLLVLLRERRGLSRAAEAIQRSEERLRQAVRLSVMGIFDHDQRTEAVYWSPEQRQIYGVGADETITLAGFLELVFPEDRPRIAEAVARAHSPGSDGRFDVEHRIVRRDGSIRWVRTRSQTLFEGEGAERRPFRTVGATADFTERREAEEALRLFRHVTDVASDAIFWVNREARFRYVNEQACRSLGYSREELLGLTLWDINPVYPRQGWEQFWEGSDAARAHERETIQTVHRRKDGTTFPVEVQVQHVNLADGAFRVGYARDITARLATEAALKESEDRLREAVLVTGLGIFDHDLLADTLHSSPEHRRMYGFDETEPVSLERFLERVHPADRGRVAEAARRAHDPAGDGLLDDEHRVLSSEGTIRWVAARARTFFVGQGADRRPARTVGATFDITVRRRAEETLRLQEKAITTSMNGMVITDPRGAALYVNPAFLAMTGYDSEREVLGMTPADFADADAAAAMFEHIRRHGNWQGEVTARRKDGSTFRVLISASALTDKDGTITHLMASFLDVTERNLLEAQLRQAQRMESIGRLAGGVAHDFNNLLTAINGFLELAMLEADPSDPIHDMLDGALRAGRSAADLTQQLLAFSRKQVINPQVLNLNSLIQNLRKMLERVLGEEVHLQTVFAQDLGQVRVDAGQVEQILLNLAVNARDAMPRGGRLTLETANVTREAAGGAGHGTLAPGDYVMLAVSDEGAGISEEVKAHLFEPFFTTKPAGMGTGLGLAMVYGAVKQNLGGIDVESEPGRGTTFRVYFPRVAERPEAGRGRAVHALDRGSETVVLVEDEAQVRQVAVRLLEHLGYRVLSFADAAEALEGVRAATEQLDILLTDVVLPDMNGRLLAERIKALRPDIRVLYASGYAESVVAEHGVLEPGIEFIPKPYSIGQLSRRVREVLDGR